MAVEGHPRRWLACLRSIPNNVSSKRAKLSLAAGGLTVAEKAPALVNVTVEPRSSGIVPRPAAAIWIVNARFDGSDCGGRVRGEDFPCLIESGGVQVGINWSDICPRGVS